MNEIEKLKKMIAESSNIVIFSGAGLSTLSGIKDFRSPDGLYSMSYNYPPEYMLSNECFYRHPEDFYDFYKKYMNCLNYEPNIVHKYFKELEEQNKLSAIITQNIDGLHTKAGNKNVYEIHGSIYKNHCLTCNRKYDANFVFESKDIPKCSCDGIIKPDVILYGEELPNKEVEKSLKAINAADMLIVVGTSLTVYPANDMLNYFHGKYFVILNMDKTSYDNKADLVINKDLKEIFSHM